MTSSTTGVGTEAGIVILGVPRSGTTLVRRCLNAHPQIACPAETTILSACARFLQTEQVGAGLEYGVLTGLSFAGFDSQTVLEELRRFMFGFHERYASSKGKRRWAEKTAVDIFHLGEIELLCGDHVQYVCVVRHALDVISSLYEFSNRGYTYLTELHAYIKRHPNMLEAFAHAWTEANADLLKFVERHPSTAILVRYESLVSDPASTIRDILAFLGETYPDDLLNNAFDANLEPGFGDWKSYRRQQIDSASVERWRALPKALVSRLAEICNPTLTALGYESVSVSPKDSPELARRKFEFALLSGSLHKEQHDDAHKK